MFIERYGLDEPIPVQFVIYLAARHGDLGELDQHSPAGHELLIERLPTTIELTFFALLFAIVVGVTLVSSRHTAATPPPTSGRWSFANLGVSIPVFVLGLLLAFVFAVVLQGHAVRPAAIRPRLSPASASIAARRRSGAWRSSTGPPRAILDFMSNMYMSTRSSPSSSGRRSTRSAT